MASRSSDFKLILDSLSHREIQIIYTRVDRKAGRTPQFTHYRLGESPEKWFAPASMVKLPAAILALEKVRELSPMGISRDTRMETGAYGPCQTARVRDESETGYPSIAQYIRKIFWVSDNEAYTRLFEFCGPCRLNTRMWEMGYTRARILRRFASCDAEENRLTNPVSFLDDRGNMRYFQPPILCPLEYEAPLGEIKRGAFHENAEGDIVPGPFDFSHRNFIPLRDLHKMLMHLVYPEAVAVPNAPQLTDSDREFLLGAMCALPSASQFPGYDPRRYLDNHVKYLLWGDQEPPFSPHIRIYNKVGQSFGYLSDVAYITDKEKDIAFFLSAVVYTNGNNTMNDGDYEYKEIGMPFLGALGRLIYDYEVKVSGK